MADELMSIASLLELACKAEDVGGRGFCLPYPGVAKDETCGLPVGTTSYTSMRLQDNEKSEGLIVPVTPNVDPVFAGLNLAGLGSRECIEWRETCMKEVIRSYLGARRGRKV